jgi:hypothetical protein
VVIDEAMVSRVADLANGRGLDSTLQESLKQDFPGIRFTLCSEDDIHAGKPVLEHEGFDIYLVGNSDHCLTLTNDYTLATGVVIAEKYPEEE